MPISDVNDFVTSIRKRNRLGADKQRKQGGSGSNKNSAGLGEQLGGDPQRAQQSDSVRLGSGQFRTNFSDNQGGTGSITTSRPVKKGAGTFSVLDQSGARDVDPGAAASLNAIRAGKASGLPAAEILANARQARAQASGNTIDAEIARVQKQRADGKIIDSVANSQLDNLFNRKKQQDTLTFNKEKAAQGQTNLEAQSLAEVQAAAEEKAQAEAAATGKAQATRLTTLKAERKASSGIKASLEKNAFDQGIKTDTEEFKRSLASQALAVQPSAVTQVSEAITSGNRKQAETAVQRLINDFKNNGIEITAQDLSNALGAL